MKTTRLFSTLFLVLIFLACTKKSEIKTYDFYNAIISNSTEKENEVSRQLSGSISIDEKQKKVTCLINGTNYSIVFKILDKNKPIYFENFYLLMSTKCTDAYYLLLESSSTNNYRIENDSVSRTSMLYFASLHSRDAAILLGEDGGFTIFGVTLRKSN
jgi:hypothetical protein